ncbi:lysozyme inhibitor LprI family protein [Burkholderia cepacia]|uniref:lysozyme inhibitor LprI family protein n=1 Tax=Burkholderia cepacia TaxID=292 RepID=UPI00158933F1|nr:lysozyme inhibitor LprI family protein [Burkholderia cepacia]
MKKWVVHGGAGCLLGMALMLPVVSGAAAPSFDCAHASSGVETAICRSPALMAADRAMADAYRIAHERLDHDAGRKLVQDQKAYLVARDYAFHDVPSRAEEKTLLENLQGRTRFLRGIPAHVPAGFSGRWGSVGGLVVVDTADGAYKVSVNTVEPDMGRWICSTGGIGTLVGNKLVVKVDDGTVVQLNRDGSLLKVETNPPSNVPDWHPSYCGTNGSLDGEYFPSSGAN